MIGKKPRWGRRLVALIVLLLFAPVPAVLLLAVVQPPTTMVMLKRAAERYWSGEKPYYPRRTIVARADISPLLRRAVLASEDDRFYLHNGFDLVEIDNALKNKKRGHRLRGASTITQQVAKNIFLWEGRSYIRKGAEAWLSLWIELLLSKDRTLDLYLNLAEWGEGVFGAEAAAQSHYHKSAASLTRDEAARLAAILPSPRRWSVNGAIATKRAAPVLERMQYAAPRSD